MQYYITNCLENEDLGLEAISDGCWKVYFGRVALGMLDLRRAKPLSNRRAFSTLVRFDGTRRRFYGRALRRN